MYIVNAKKDILLNADHVSYFFISENNEIIARLKTGSHISLGNYFKKDRAQNAMNVILEDTKFSSRMCYLPDPEKKGVHIS